MDIPEITELTIRAVMLFLPGIICAELVRVFTSHGQEKDPLDPVYFIARVLVLGFVSYEVTAFIFLIYRHFCEVASYFDICLPWSDIRLHFFGSLLDSSRPVYNDEIMIVSCTAGLLALLIAGILNHEYHLILLRKIRVAR